MFRYVAIITTSKTTFRSTQPWDNNGFTYVDEDHADPWLTGPYAQFDNEDLTDSEVSRPTEQATENELNALANGSETENETPSEEGLASAGPEGAAEEMEGLSADAAMGAGGPELMPFAIAHQMQTAMGDSLNNHWYDNAQTNNLQQYLQNQHNTGPLGAQTVKNIYDWNTQQNQNTRGYGSIGNQLGLLGLIGGHYIGEGEQTSIPQELKDTAWSAAGRIDPTSDGVNETLDAASINPEEMLNGMQASEASSSVDDETQ